MTVCKLGVIFVYAVGMCCSYKVNQIVYLSVASAHVLAFCFMPESPNYLLKIGKEKKAAKTISWLRSLKTSSTLVTDEIMKLKEEQRRFDATPRVTLLSVGNKILQYHHDFSG
ncbi:hypothetical protein O3G_MSEX014679 [Manduca sexta]|uniref:Uncharacterized protein n=1 Tax=Manduca sexta TaxID=7130 RepID=A0A922CYL6_MANSE|nr:hypothetical protein O3G_MSEX014679 [Manduca sexta]